MTELPVDTPSILEIHLQLSQYPILAQQIRKRMREEIYRRGVTTSERFENEARDKAIKSQRREGMMNPLDEEDAEQWERRLQQIRDYLTDFYFAYNLPLDLLQRLIDEAIAQRLPGGESGTRLTFNPELAPLDFILRKAQEYDCLLYTSDAADERSSVDLGGRRIIKKKKTEEYRSRVEIEV